MILNFSLIKMSSNLFSTIYISSFILLIGHQTKQSCGTRSDLSLDPWSTDDDLTDITNSSEYPPRENPAIGHRLNWLDKQLSECNGIDIREITFTKIQKYFKHGNLTSAQLTQCYINRIHAMDPYLKSVLELNPDALAIAEQLDKERIANGGFNNSLLYGVPILIKGHIGTGDKMETSAGATSFIGLKPSKDAPLVAQLRKAGVVILGKSSLAELSGFRSCSGYGNGLRGNTLNPYNLSIGIYGSSSGSGAAVAANLCAGALGGQSYGSIVFPSTRGFLVGIKPTVWRVSSKGCVPWGLSQDAVGPMTRTAKDAAILLKSILIPSKNSPDSIDIEEIDSDTPSNKTLRVGVLRHIFDALPEQLKVQYQKVLEALPSTGIVLVDPVDNKNITFGPKEQIKAITVFHHEFKAAINQYINITRAQCKKWCKSPITNLKDMINFNKGHISSKWCPQLRMEAAEATDSITNSTYIEARTSLFKLSREWFQSIIKTYDLDALTAPTFTSLRWDLYNLADTAQYPVVSVPVINGENYEGFALSFSGLPKSEQKLLVLASKTERKIKARKRPKFVA